MAQFEYRLPDLGEGVTEGELVKWLVRPGDEVQADQPLVEVMTDKATVTVPSPRRGRVVRTVGALGDWVQVQTTLVVLELSDGEAPPAARHRPADAPAILEAAPAAVAAPPATVPPPPSSSATRVLATPVTRRMARELGVDLSAVAGTGPQGRVMKSDLLLSSQHGARTRTPAQPGETAATLPFAARPAADAPSSQTAPQPAHRARPLPPPLAADEVRPLRGLRRSIARAMAQSHTYVVPFTFVEECDTLRLTHLRAAINEQLERAGHPKLSYLPFVVQALLRGLRRFPEMNAWMDEEKQELVVKREVHLGFGAATEQGLTVFVVHDAARLGVRRLGAEIDRLSLAAREQKLTPQELAGATFTITSLGKDGGLFATPVVKHPEVAILGLHKIKEVPRVVQGEGGRPELAIGEQMNLSCSFDHRVIDGHIGAAFLYEVIGALEAPESLLLDQSG